MKRIAIIENGFARDTYIFTTNPAIIEIGPDWEENFCDVKYSCLYIGIFEGIHEKEIQESAAAALGVHPDVISLVGIDCEQNVDTETNTEDVIVGRAINGVTINGLEFLLDKEHEIMKFPNVDAAKKHMSRSKLENGFSQEAIEDITFLDAETDESISQSRGYICPVCENENHPLYVRFCIICGNPLLKHQQKNERLEIDRSEFERLRSHFGHKIEVAVYGDDQNVAIECMDCHEVLYSVDKPQADE